MPIQWNLFWNLIQCPEQQWNYRISGGYCLWDLLSSQKNCFPWTSFGTLGMIDMATVDGCLHIPWIHINEFCISFQSLYMECSKSHDPVPKWCLLVAFLWLVDGSEDVSHFLYFSITWVQDNHLTYAKYVHTNNAWNIGRLDYNPHYKYNEFQLWKYLLFTFWKFDTWTSQQ